MIPEPVTVALNTSTFTKISIPAANEGPRTLKVSTSDLTAFTISNTLAGTAAINMAANYTYDLIATSDSDGGVFYAKASAGTPNLSVLVQEKI
ncbi:MAG: hypothetical protein GY800_08975 [Planctomycetes bacterium]|nr:hypothetical protein [Planctomycetota bacterium]